MAFAAALNVSFRFPHEWMLLALVSALQGVSQISHRVLDITNKPTVFGRVPQRSNDARLFHFLGLRFKLGNQLTKMEPPVWCDAIGICVAERVDIGQQAHPLSGRRMRLRQNLLGFAA